MLTREAYAFYEAGGAVAAVHLGLRIRQISVNPARAPTDVTFPRTDPKARFILWLTGLAAEKKGVGECDPFRRMKNRRRVRAEAAAAAEALEPIKAKREKFARTLLNQAQDQANAICAQQFAAIEAVARRLLEAEVLTGREVEQLVREARATNREPAMSGTEFQDMSGSSTQDDAASGSDAAAEDMQP